MSKFYLLLWLRWAFLLSFKSLLYAGVLSSLITLYLYFDKGFPSLEVQVYVALFKIFSFWLKISWSVTLLLALFSTLKSVFNNCHNGFKLELLHCPKENEKEAIEFIGYGDLVKVWRKWLMLLIWITAVEMTLALVYTHLILSFESLFDWFNIYVLYIFILIAGYFGLMILSVRCKKVRLSRC